jgi:hypothetical protein
VTGPNVADVLLGLVDAGVVMWVEGDRLRYRAPAGALSAALRDGAARCRGALVALVKAGAVLPAEVTTWRDPWRHAFEERAAIQEFEGGLVREVAEREAERLVRVAYAHAFVERAALVVQPPAAAVATARPGGDPNR